MKASYLISYGRPDSLQYGELPEPVIKPGTLFVRIKAVSVNPVDWKIKQGLLKIIKGSKFPMVIGSDFAGVVEQVAPGIKDFVPGDRVYGAISAFSKQQGALSELALVETKYARKIPYFMSFEQAASLPIAALTALNGLRRTMTGAGVKVLVNGATGGVGHFAVQMAKARGAHVTATCSSRNVSLAKELGADRIYNYSGENTIPDGTRFDAIMDAWGMMAYSEIHRLLKPEGIYASPLYMPWTVFAATYVRLRYGRRMTSSNMRTHPEDYAQLEALIESGKLKPFIESTFPLEKAAEAFEKAEFGKPRGKLIIKVGNE
ncbi:MAG: NADP-dependent oxidoreductase [Marinilabiliaceae bacterium]|jgi:NADPH:quinone reductase-like Zn-dependent oxidoreductase|nr:NADP-dependent oxidoreductase [Marinilabiliaceae bacterium]